MNNGRMISLILAIIIAFSAVPMAYGTGDSADYNYAPIAENIEVKTYKNVASPSWRNLGILHQRHQSGHLLKCWHKKSKFGFER